MGGQGKTRAGLPGRAPPGFTLIELLVVIALIALLVSIAMPSLGMARQAAQSAACLSNLHHLGLAMGMYHTKNKGLFWRCKMVNYPAPLKITYFWGAIDMLNPSAPVDPLPSPLLLYTDRGLGLFWCEALSWGSYVPQGSVSEPTTTYAYNAPYLDRASYMWGCPDPPRNIGEIPDPASLFVFNDGATLDTWGAGGVFKNSTYMEPPVPPAGFTVTPTTHFRHNGQANALCADGHAEAFDSLPGDINLPEYDLGFVDKTNEPHYAQE